MARSSDRSNRFERSRLDLLRALDDHQYLLRHALHGLRNDRAHIKALATELRALICTSSGTEGLLWRMADALNVSDVLELQAVQSVNRDHPLNRGLLIEQIPLWRPGEGPPGLLTEYHRLRDVIKQYEAIYVAQIPDKIYTHELLIKDIAQQMGAAHEDDGLDYSLVQINNLRVNDTGIYFKVLVFDAELTLQIGERVLDQAEQQINFHRAERPEDYGDLTLSVRLTRNIPLAGRVPIVTMRSQISEAEITCSAAAQSVDFTLTKRGTAVGELHAPYPSDWQDTTDAQFSLSYSSTHRQARTITNDQVNGTQVQCDFGWLDARELGHEGHTGFEDFFILGCVALYERLLSPKKCGDLLQISSDGRELFVQRPIGGVFP